MGKARLLVVEDDFDIANMLHIYFTGQGYQVDIAPRGSEALEKTRQNLPHLIILDIMLPHQPRTHHFPHPKGRA
jgi:DNA-binding response OmpR family regulator